MRLLVSQDAFHRAYQAPASAALVSSFFLHNRESPQSIENGLARVIEQLELLGGDQAFPESPPRLAAGHLRFVRDIPLERALAEETKEPLSDHIEERQLYRSRPLELHEFLNESAAILLSPEINREANRLFRPASRIGDCVSALNSHLYQKIKYKPGSTRIDTPPAEVLSRGEGVCQDLAQLMIAILRSAEIPARYVCGYIETEPQRAASATDHARPLVGFAESHAWVEVCLPGGHWWGLDPTNNCPAGPRHVLVATGRDYQDTTPTRGVFKGSSAQKLQVSVQMRRLPPTP